jgi:Ca2+-binding RTX toxin-like protein
VRSGRLPRFLVCLASLGLIWPAAVAADHFTPTATVSAAVTERASADTWTIVVRWDAGCQGATAGRDYYEGNLHLVDLDTGTRTYIGGGPGMAASGLRDRRIVAIAREQHLRPELEITCYVTLPFLHGAGYHITVTGNPVTIPARFGGGGAGGGGSGSGSGSGGGGDPTEPLRAGGCRVAILGTNRADTLTGGGAGEVMIGFAGSDRMRGEDGHDCLVGGPGVDRLSGGDGDDRLVGGRGRDTLVGGPGGNAYDAGVGNDVVRARNGRRELVVCGPGRDRAYVDRRDRVRGCELSLVGAGR